MSSRDGHGTARLPASFAQVTAELIPADGKFHSWTKIHRMWFSWRIWRLKMTCGFNYFHFGKVCAQNPQKQNLENNNSDYVRSKDSCCLFVRKKKMANLDPYRFLRGCLAPLFFGRQFLRLEQMKSSPKRRENSEVLRNMNSKGSISRSCFFPCHIIYTYIHVSIPYMYYFICIYTLCVMFSFRFSQNPVSSFASLCFPFNKNKSFPFSAAEVFCISLWIKSFSAWILMPRCPPAGPERCWKCLRK